MANTGPAAIVRRSWRRLRRRPVGIQIGSLVLALAVVGGVVYGVSAGTSSSGGSTGPGGTPGLGNVSGVGVDQASTSNRGVTGSTINVVFPVSNLPSLAANFGFQGDTEFGVQPAAIHTYVNAVNDAGGINGRRINPIIVRFDATSETNMRSLCKQWTEGNPPVFAVIDGLGAWTGDNELCVAQEGQTPFIGQWTTVTNWTQQGAPYLWWTGADQAQILAALVTWGQQQGLITNSPRLGIVAGDRTSDQRALKDYLLPDLRRAGFSDPMIQSIPANPQDTAASNAAAPLIVQRFKAAGVQSVLPLIPFNAFFPFLAQENAQNYYPKLLLSDYESSIEVTLGLIPIPYEQSLEGQGGVTAETLGGTDAPISPFLGGYNPGVTSCYNTWKAHNPPTSSESPYIEEQGPIVGWCQAIRLFAQAAQNAGPNLNRRTFVQAMSRIQNIDGTYVPTLSYGPNKYYGPTQYQVVTLHNNVPPGPTCVPTYTGKPQGTCWHVIQGWRPFGS
jgi:hypothetical protein